MADFELVFEKLTEAQNEPDPNGDQLILEIAADAEHEADEIEELRRFATDLQDDPGRVTYTVS